MTQPLTTTDLEAVLAEEIPCTGIRNEGCSRECSQAGTLRWTNPHSCKVGRGDHRSIKCADCWMALYQYLANRIAQDGTVRCCYCSETFGSVLAFTDYRPF